MTVGVSLSVILPYIVLSYYNYTQYESDLPPADQQAFISPLHESAFFLVLITSRDVDHPLTPAANEVCFNIHNALFIIS